jgi:hypothetical protein
VSDWATPGGADPTLNSPGDAGAAIAWRSWPLAVVLAVASTFCSSAARSQPAPDTSDVHGLPIRNVSIEPRNIFDAESEGPLSGLYRFANSLHIRTRTNTIREQLLFGPGDTWTEDLGREQARNLRALRFLNPLEVSADRQGDSVDVRVVTRDLWTTSPEFNFESSGGKRYGSVAFSEKNLLGLGKFVSVAWRHDPVGTSRAIFYADPSVLGSRLRFQIGAGTGRGGASGAFWFGVPYFALDTKRSYGVSWRRVTSDAVLYEHGAEIARINQKWEETELWWGTGGSRDSVIRRVRFGLFFQDKRLGPTVEFSPVPPEFAGGEESRRVRRGTGAIRVWRPQYIEPRNVDQIAMVEDIDIGVSAEVEAGYAPGWFGGVQEGWVSMRFDRGQRMPGGYATARGRVTSRLRASPVETQLEADVRLVSQALPRQTLVLAALGIAGLNMDRDYQIVWGGLNGLRAYNVQAVAGRRGWRLNAEHRLLLGERIAGYMGLGLVAFVDAAIAWGPGSGGAGWFVNGGTGLRFNAPGWTIGNVLRVDVAFPIEPTRDGARGAVFSFGSSQAF